MKYNVNGKETELEEQRLIDREEQRLIDREESTLKQRMDHRRKPPIS